MKLVHITCQIQYAEAVEAILDRHGLEHWVRSGRIGGRDRDGRHDGSQAFPGGVTLVQTLLPDGAVDDLFEDLEAFRDDKASHRHLVAAVLAAERTIGVDDDPGDGDRGPGPT